MTTTATTTEQRTDKMTTTHQPLTLEVAHDPQLDRPAFYLVSGVYATEQERDAALAALPPSLKLHPATFYTDGVAAHYISGGGVLAPNPDGLVSRASVRRLRRLLEICELVAPVAHSYSTTESILEALDRCA